MTYSFLGIALLSVWTVQAQNLTSLLAKTKRNLSGDIQSYGESSLVLPYTDSPKLYYGPRNVNTYQVRPLAVVDLSQPLKLIEPKVAAQQVLYEFQQTPTNAVSNVHVKQLFEQNMKPPPPNISPSTLTTSETVVPVHQSHQYIQNPNPQPFNIKQHPLYSVQPTFFEPKKYVYGKIIVDSTLPQPNYHQQGNPNVFYSNQQFLPQGAQHGKPILNYVNHFPRNNIMVTSEIPPITQNLQFRPPSKSQYQTINTPAYNLREDKSKHKPIEKPVVENEDADDEHEEKSNNQDEEDHEEYESPFGKYFDDEENSEYGHHENAEEEDEDADEDNKRGSSKYFSKREKYPKKYKKTKNYHSKYGIPEDRYFKNDENRHKSYKYKHSKKSKFPKPELDGRFSEQIPVTHKKKILREKWFLSKSLGDKERYDQES